MEFFLYFIIIVYNKTKRILKLWVDLMIDLLSPSLRVKVQRPDTSIILVFTWLYRKNKFGIFFLYYY